MERVCVRHASRIPISPVSIREWRKGEFGKFTALIEMLYSHLGHGFFTSWAVYSTVDSALIRKTSERIPVWKGYKFGSGRDFPVSHVVFAQKCTQAYDSELFGEIVQPQRV